MTEEQKKKLEFEVDEIIDKEKDPVYRIFYLHLKSALLAFQNTNISHEDAYLRYEKLLKTAYKFLKSGTDLTKKKEEIDISTENKTIDEIVKELTQILLTRKRRIRLEISI